MAPKKKRKRKAPAEPKVMSAKAIAKDRERFRKKYPDLAISDEELRERRLYHGKELDQDPTLGGNAVQTAKTVAGATEKYR